MDGWIDGWLILADNRGWVRPRIPLSPPLVWMDGGVDGRMVGWLVGWLVG